jgi:hypothetical protein
MSPFVPRIFRPWLALANKSPLATYNSTPGAPNRPTTPPTKMLFQSISFGLLALSLVSASPSPLPAADVSPSLSFSQQLNEVNFLQAVLRSTSDVSIPPSSSSPCKVLRTVGHCLSQDYKRRHPQPRRHLFRRAHPRSARRARCLPAW